MGKNCRHNGYTLIEVLLALFIFSIVILGTTGMQISAVKNNTIAGEHTEAVLIASSKAELLTSLTFDNSVLLEGTYSETVDSKFFLTWIIEDSDLNSDMKNDLKKIKIIVQWFYGKRENKISLILLKAKEENSS